MEYQKMIQQCSKIHFGQKFFNILSADTPSATRIDVTSCNNIFKGHALEPRDKENASNTIFDVLLLSETAFDLTN